MGDAADWLREQEEVRIYDTDWWYGDMPPAPVTCKFCGEPGLYWDLDDDTWRLYDDEGNLHNCTQHVASVDDFQDVSTKDTPIHIGIDVAGPNSDRTAYQCGYCKQMFDKPIAHECVLPEKNSDI